MNSEPTVPASGWIFEENLRPFLEVLSRFVGYSLDEDDWTAISHGVKDTFAEKGLWYDYSFLGACTAYLKVAHDEPGTGAIVLQVNVPQALRPKVEATIEIMQHFHLQRGGR